MAVAKRQGREACENRREEGQREARGPEEGLPAGQPPPTQSAQGGPRARERAEGDKRASLPLSRRGALLFASLDRRDLMPRRIGLLSSK